MPAVSSKQRTLWCIAMAIKEGKTKASYSKQAAEIAKNNSLKVIKDYCESPIKKD